LCAFLLSMFVPLTMTLGVAHATFVLFVPIMGRSGSALNPDLLIGSKSVTFTLASIRYAEMNQFVAKKCLLLASFAPW